MKGTKLTAALTALFFLAGCGGSKTDTVRIGVIAELTGAIPAVGASCRNGALMA